MMGMMNILFHLQHFTTDLNDLNYGVHATNKPTLIGSRNDLPYMFIRKIRDVMLAIRIRKKMH